jgi:hypothetical protein
MQPHAQLTSADLVELVGQAARLAGAAGRADLTDRLAQARGVLAGRRVRIAVVGAPGQGTTSVVHALERTAGERLPGASVTEVPGRPGTGQIWLPEPGAADVVLYVSEADQAYTAWELDAIARLRAQGSTVAGVISKIDLYPQWGEVQRTNRQRLQAANLDSPSVPLLPVSAGLLHAGRQRGEEPLVAASGIPQLLDFLRDRIGTPVEVAMRDAVLAEVRIVADQLGRVWNAELDGLNGSGSTPRERQDRAVADMERRQQLSASWQIALGDGVTELVSQVDFDLRDRLRDVLERAEKEIKKANPIADWRRFDESVRADVGEAVHANFALAGARSQRLAERVAAKLAGTRDGSARGVVMPKLWVEHPEEAMRLVKAMEPPETGGMFARLVNSVRGSYGGILMVGVLTSLAGLQLISVWSVGAGVLLGAFTFWEDRKNSNERGKAEATMAVSKLMDSVNFRVGDELRTQLRAVHRAMRDHFTQINDQLLRAASDSVRSAVEAVQRGDQPDSRAAELQAYLAELRQLQVRAMVPAR